MSSHAPTLAELAADKDAAKAMVLRMQGQGAPASSIRPVHERYLRCSHRIAERKAFDAVAAFKLICTTESGRVDAGAMAAAVASHGPRWLDPADAAAIYAAITCPESDVSEYASDSDDDNGTGGGAGAAGFGIEAFTAWWEVSRPADRPGEAFKLALMDMIHGVERGELPSEIPALRAQKEALREQLTALRDGKASVERVLPVYLRYKDVGDLLRAKTAALDPEIAGATDGVGPGEDAAAGVGTSGAAAPEPARTLASRISSMGGGGGLRDRSMSLLVQQPPDVPGYFDVESVSLTVYFPYFVGLYSKSLMDVSIGQAHVELLLRKLLQPGNDDTTLVRVFLITRIKVMSSSALLTLLVQRYSAAPSPELDRRRYHERTLPGVRNKVLAFLVAWMTDFYPDLLEPWSTPTQVDKLRLDASCMGPFVERAEARASARPGASTDPDPARLTVADVLSAWLGALAADRPASTTKSRASSELDFVIQLARYKAGFADSEWHKRFDPRQFSQHIPPPILPTNLNSLTSIMEISPVEIARQLTFADYKAFYAIRPSDYLAKDSSPAPPMVAFSKRFERMTNWFTTMILEAEDSATRAALMCKLVDVGVCCHGLDNYSSALSVVLAFSQAPVTRLTRTFARLPDEYRARYEDLESLVDIKGKFRYFRMRAKHVVAPAVPFLVPFLGDVIAMDGAQDTYVEDSGVTLLNVDKLTIIANSVDVPIKFRSPYAEYAIQPIHQIQAFLSGSQPMSLHEMQERSMEIQPRGSKVRKCDRKPIEYSDATYEPGSVSKTTFWNMPASVPVVPDTLLSCLRTQGFVDGTGSMFDANVVYDSESALPEPLKDASPAAAPFEVPPMCKLHPMEVARQLTLEDFAAFEAIDAAEFGRYTSGVELEGSSAPITDLLERFNYRVRWAMSCVIGIESGPCERAWMICFLLEVAHGCKLLNNYSSMCAITLGLQSAAVERLAATWALVPGEMIDTVKAALDAVVVPTHGFAAYFVAIKKVPPPLVPNVMFHLQAMVVHITNEAAGQTPEAKLATVEDYVAELATFTEYAYHLRRVPEVLDMVEGVYVHKEANLSYARSMLLEDGGAAKAGGKPVPYDRVLAKQPV